ncbi:MAG: PEGA domain-containing protein, partial [Myxococcaceae bacterium]|nr:PEGA domain-containing protein [Myxococcaceae bacterium]
VARSLEQWFPGKQRPGVEEVLSRGTVSVRAPAPMPRVLWALLVVPVVIISAAATWWKMRPFEAPPAPTPTPVVAVPAPEPAPPTPEPEPEPEPEPAAPAKPAAAKGQLWVKVKPWGRVFVDGKLRGTTPLAPLPLPNGAHQVLVVNEELKAKKTFSVDVRGGKTTELKVVLSEQ